MRKPGRLAGTAEAYRMLDVLDRVCGHNLSTDCKPCMVEALAKRRPGKVCLQPADRMVHAIFLTGLPPWVPVGAGPVWMRWHVTYDIPRSKVSGEFNVLVRRGSPEGMIRPFNYWSDYRDTAEMVKRLEFDISIQGKGAGSL